MVWLSSRRGVALASAVVGLTLSGLFIAGALGMLIAIGRTGQAHMEQAAARASARLAVQVGLAELGHLGTLRGSDILSAQPSAVVYRAGRGTALLCGTTVDGVLLEAARFRALRLPAAGRDSLEFTMPGPSPGWAWNAVAVSGPTRTATCPDGAPAIAVPTSPVPAPSTAAPDRLAVRLFEVMELRAYSSGGQSWLGLRAVGTGEAIQPVLGPLASGGFLLEYFDATGTPAASVLDVRRIRLTIRVLTDATVAAGGLGRAAGGGAARVSTEFAIAGAAP